MFAGWVESSGEPCHRIERSRLCALADRSGPKLKWRGGAGWATDGKMCRNLLRDQQIPHFSSSFSQSIFRTDFEPLGIPGPQDVCAGAVCVGDKAMVQVEEPISYPSNEAGHGRKLGIFFWFWGFWRSNKSSPEAVRKREREREWLFPMFLFHHFGAARGLGGEFPVLAEQFFLLRSQAMVGGHDWNQKPFQAWTDIYCKSETTKQLLYNTLRW